MSRIIVLLMFAFVVSPGVAQKVRVDYDRACNFSLYKTYQWAELPKAHFLDAQFPNQLMQERIVGFVEEALAARHLSRVDKGGDLLIGYRMSVESEPQFTTLSTGPGWGNGFGGWGWGGGWDSGFSTTTTQTLFTATLALSMEDARQKHLVFQGESTDGISSKAAKNSKRLQKGIDKIFENYPPKG